MSQRSLIFGSTLLLGLVSTVQSQPSVTPPAMHVLQEPAMAPRREPVAPVVAVSQRLEGAQPVTLSQALEAARVNIDVALAGHALSAARADVLSADHAPVPVMTAKLGSIDLQNGIGGGSLLGRKRIDKSLGVDWTWERGGKRVLRTRSAQSNAQAAQADVEDTRIAQQIAAHGAFFDLLAAQERVGQVRAIAQSAARLADTANKRLRAGDLAAQDAARTEIESQRAAIDVQSAGLELRRASLALAQLLGRAADGRPLAAEGGWPVGLAAQRAMGLPASAAEMSALVEARPDVAAARARVQAAQAALEGAAALKRADITWGASIDHFPGTSTRQVELRMQIPLQLDALGAYNYQGEAARAQALLMQAEETLDKTRRLAQIELERMRHDAVSTAQRAASYDGDILPRARRVAQQAELAYNKGALSLSDLLDARRTLRSTELDALSARADHAKALGAWRLRTQADAVALRDSTQP